MMYSAPIGAAILAVLKLLCHRDVRMARCKQKQGAARRSRRSGKCGVIKRVKLLFQMDVSYALHRTMDQ